MRTNQNSYAISGLQKNPRRDLILTGIYAENQKLKYGVDESSSCINFLTEILPGTALAVFAFRGLRTLKQKHRCGLRISTRHKAVYAARYSTKIKTPIKGV